MRQPAYRRGRIRPARTTVRKSLVLSEDENVGKRRIRGIRARVRAKRLEGGKADQDKRNPITIHRFNILKEIRSTIQ
jgi:hypothetical protein